MSDEYREIFCCGCNGHVSARLTDGKEIYPHRKDLYSLPFWRCDSCGNYVGCHHKTSNRTNSLGFISTAELRKARIHIHDILDPLWESGKIKRGALYKKITDEVGWNFHTSKIKTIEEAREIYKIIKGISECLN